MMLPRLELSIQGIVTKYHSCLSWQCLTGRKALLHYQSSVIPNYCTSELTQPEEPAHLRINVSVLLKEKKSSLQASISS